MSYQWNGEGSGFRRSCGGPCEGDGPGNGSAVATGWMYVNQAGQMCGPYVQDQLYEGLSSGFLPEDLPVYPLLNGKLANSVPLKYFNRFPDHVPTGFSYLSLGSSAVSAAVYPSSHSASGFNVHCNAAVAHLPKLNASQVL